MSASQDPDKFNLSLSGEEREHRIKCNNIVSQLSATPTQSGRNCTHVTSSSRLYLNPMMTSMSDSPFSMTSQQTSLVQNRSDHATGGTSTGKWTQCVITTLTQLFVAWRVLAGFRSQQKRLLLHSRRRRRRRVIPVPAKTTPDVTHKQNQDLQKKQASNIPRSPFENTRVIQEVRLGFETISGSCCLQPINSQNFEGVHAQES